MKLQNIILLILIFLFVLFVIYVHSILPVQRKDPKYKMPTTAKYKKVIFIGAGPVALWTASNILLNHPNTKIIFYEKHATYQRKQKIFISPSSLMFAKQPGNKLSDKLEKVVEEVKSNTGAFPIQKIENILKSILQSSSVEFVHKYPRNYFTTTI